MTPEAVLFSVPYDSGQHEVRMGRGPRALMAAGAAHRLRDVGYQVHEVELAPASGWLAEIATTFELHRALAGSVQLAVTEGALPVVLAGNCGHAVGTVAGLSAGLTRGSARTGFPGTTAAGVRIGVVWLDAHPDFKTPETTTSGFLDGMGLATLTGQCWRTLAASVPGFCPVAPADVILVGARDMSATERTALDAAGVRVVSPAAVRAQGMDDALGPALNHLQRAGVTHLYLHLDLDVYDPAAVGPANAYAARGGLTAAEVQTAVRLVAAMLPIAAVGVASYDPTADADGHVAATALDLLALVAQVRRASPWAT